jgi:uroporphyrinogen decarboxylase
MPILSQLALSSPARLAMPIAVHPGLALTGASVRDAVTSSTAQFEAAAALLVHTLQSVDKHERFKVPVVMSAMDLSVEAEAFGCAIHMSDDEVPTVIGNLVTTFEQARDLAVPAPGAGRTGVYIETVRRLRQLPDRPVVLAGCIGPFSLASRLVGMSEACSLTLLDPAWMHQAVEKATAFLTAYALAFKTAGADGILMAEPGAGLLSPKGLAEFSSAYVRRIVNASVDGSFELILHNCAARLVHLPAVRESGAKILHFGAPMDVTAALSQVPGDVLVCGNLDPTRVFVQSTAGEVASQTRALLDATRGFRNFIISSGCDIPARAPLANVAAFFAAATSGD